MAESNPADLLTRLTEVCRDATTALELQAQARPLVEALTELGMGDTADGLVALAEERLVVRAELADLTARVDNAQHLAGMGDYDWHIATDTNRWSDELYRIYGHEPQSFNASYERFLAHIHPDDRERIQAIHQQAYATGEPYSMIERIVRPDGEVRHLSSNGQVLMGPDGTPERMRGTCVDITERVLAEQARERATGVVRALVEAAPDAIMVYDRSGTIVRANRHAVTLLGGDPVGREIGSLLPEVPPGDLTAGPRLGSPAVGLDGRPLELDVECAGLDSTREEWLAAAFMRESAPRLAHESTAATLREAQVRRSQALELNDNVMQGLTAAQLALQAGDPGAASTYLVGTVTAARYMMNEWLAPLDGTDLQPGDLIRSTPAALPESETPEEIAMDDGPGRVRILVVDDNTDVRRLLRLKLEDNSTYEVVGEGADGLEAVELTKSLRPDVLILDLAMPRMDGLQALPLVREAHPGVRVVVLSGFDEETMAGPVLAAGAHAYVAKGLRMDLDSVIGSVLGQAASSRETGR